MPQDPAPFPLDSLVPWQRSMVQEVATATKTDPSIAAMMSLAVLSSAVGRKVIIETDSDLTPPAHIWVLVIAGTGLSKSPIFGSIVEPLRVLQASLDRPAGPKATSRSRTVWDVLTEAGDAPDQNRGEWWRRYRNRRHHPSSTAGGRLPR